MFTCDAATISCKQHIWCPCGSGRVGTVFAPFAASHRFGMNAFCNNSNRTLGTCSAARHGIAE